MLSEGVEPSRHRHWFLKPACLPFHHTPYIVKATPRFELGIENLQSTALPLGHIAFNFILINITLFIKTSQVFNIKFKIKQKKIGGL